MIIYERKSSFLLFKSVYFIVFTFFGAVSPLLSLLYKEYGLTSSQIGLLSFISPAVNFIAVPVMCAIADKLKIHKFMLLSCIASSATIQCLILVSKTFSWQAWIQFLFSICVAPVASLIDAATLTALAGSSTSYGELRMWGAVGFGIITLASGVIIQSPYSWTGVCIMYALTALISIIVCLFFKMEIASAKHDHQLWDHLTKVLNNGEAVMILSTLLISGISMGIIDTFLFVWLFDLGGRGDCIGMAKFVMCAAEIPLFHFSGKLIRWGGIKQVLAFTQLAYIVRFLYYCYLVDPWWVLPCEVLHGVTFGVMWSAASVYAHSIASDGTASTLQGLMSGLQMGLGFGIGTVGGGYLYQTIGPVMLFQLGAALSTFSFCIMLCACFFTSSNNDYEAIIDEDVDSHTRKEIEFEPI